MIKSKWPAYTIDTDGKEKQVEPINGSDFTQLELYALVGSDELIYDKTFDGRIIVWSKESAYINVKGSLLQMKDDYMINGNVLVCHPKYIK